jgi:magnesium-transporting ATPase (P-type)
MAMNISGKVTNNRSLFEKDVSPFTQLFIILGATVAVQLLMYLYNTLIGDTFLQRTYYTIAISFVLVFAMFNSVLSLSAKDPNGYWWKSLISFVILCFGGATTAHILSGLSLDDAGAFRWMYVVFSMGYILFLGILRSMRWIVEYAQKKDKRMRGEN